MPFCGFFTIQVWVDIPSMVLFVKQSTKHLISSQIAPTLDTRGTTIGDIIDRVFNNKPDSWDEYEPPSWVPQKAKAPSLQKKIKTPIAQTESQKKAKLKTQTSQAACQL